MRRSPQRHTLAVLRTTIGLTQKELAALVQCSTPTVQAIELGKLRLSQGLAERIAFQTGAALEWLFGNDTSQPPRDTLDGPVTKETFIETQAELRRPQNTPDDALRVKKTYLFAISQVGSVLSRALEQGRVDLYVYKLMSALEKLSAELGEEPLSGTHSLNIRAKEEKDAVWKAHLASPDLTVGSVQHFFQYCDGHSKRQRKALAAKARPKRKS